MILSFLRSFDANFDPPMPRRRRISGAAPEIQDSINEVDV